MNVSWNYDNNTTYNLPFTVSTCYRVVYTFNSISGNGSLLRVSNKTLSDFTVTRDYYNISASRPVTIDFIIIGY